jgi:fibronectin-binding autotransporter adhesin
MVFNSGASAYHFTIQRSGDFGFYGAGLQNNSGAVQLFDVLATDTASDYTYLTLSPGSAAGSNVVITTHGADFADGANPGVTQLFNASAGSATLINNGGLASGARGGEVDFFPQGGQGGHAGNATIINNPGTVAGALGGRSNFYSGSADNAVITSEGATVSGALGGLTQFANNAGAGSATLIAKAGINGGEGGVIQFEYSSFAPNARFEVFGNGSLDISLVNPGSFEIGSLEGDGQVYLGASQLSVGVTNLDTTFSGVIHDSGSLEKIGNASFTMTGANLYTGGTTVTSGTLVVGNVTGSGTGIGAVAVNSGTLGGSGTIAGSVTVGTDSGPGAFLAPAHSGNQQLTLTIQSSLTLNSDATYTYTFKAKRNRFKIDKVIANGVMINGGATINLSGTTQGQLTQGMVLTLIKNTAVTPIAGAFANLPDGGIVTINGNNFQASYSGGDGNDLTLTVVP